MSRWLGGIPSSASTSSAGASPARTSPAPDRERASSSEPGAGSGSSTCGSSASSAPAPSSSRTSRAASRGGSRSSGKGSKVSGIERVPSRYLPRTSAPPTSDGASSSSGSTLLPTPSATDYGTSNNGNPGDERTAYATAGKMSLATMARKGALALWPTPMAHDAKSTGPSDGRKRSPGLAWAAQQDPWPTPRASDSIRGATKTERDRTEGGDLPTAVYRRQQWATPCASDDHGPKGTATNGGRNLPREVLAGGTSGALNPTWVEGLMGFPHGWTDI